jgi:FkbM family methyltransferase
MDKPEDNKTFVQSLNFFIKHLAFCWKDNKVVFAKYLAYSLGRAISYPIRRAKIASDDGEQRYQRAIKDKKEVKVGILGYNMILPTADTGLTRDIIIDGVREKNSVGVFFKEYRPDMNTIDLGANLGYYLLMEASVRKKYNGKGTIYAIEPNPYTFEYLNKNIKLNNYSDIKTMNLAIGEKKEVKPFYLSKNWNCSRFVPGPDTSDIVEVKEMKIETLDNLFAKKKIDFIRMDVEGFEFNILRGAKKLIADNPNIAIFFEFHAQFFTTPQREEIIKFLKDNKLRVKYLFTGDENGAKMKPYSRGYKDIRNARYTTYYLYLQGPGNK